MKKRIISIVILIALISSLVVIGGCGKKEPKVYKIGVCVALTGDSGLWGQNARKGMQIVLDQVNFHKGINGEKLELVYEDNQGKPSQAVSAFKKLIDVNKVPMVLGGMLTSTTLAMAPLANNSKVVLMGISTSSPVTTKAGPYIYRVWPSDLYEGTIFAKWVFQHGYKKVGILYLHNDYGEGLKTSFEKEFILLGGTITRAETFTDLQKDFRSILEKVKNTNPDAIYIVGYYQNTALIVRQASQLRIKSLLLGTSSAENPELIEIAGKAAEGFIYPVVNDFDLENLTVQQEKFYNEFEDRYGFAPGWDATHGADALKVAITCLKNGAISGEQIKNYIDKRRIFEGVTGEIVFDENGDPINKPIVIKIVRNGRFQRYRK